MKTTIIAVLAVLAVIAALAVFSAYVRPVGKKTETKILSVGNAVFEVGIANDAASRIRGLSGRTSLGENEGLLFLFSSPGNYGFWMKDMNFPIDIVWIRSGIVVGVSKNLQPEPQKTIFTLPIYYPPGDVDKVLEINAGAVSKYGIKEGDVVELR